jgi:hypothetical protein
MSEKSLLLRLIVEDPPKSPTRYAASASLSLKLRLKKGDFDLILPHPSRSPLKGERSKDEALYSLGGWGGSIDV